MPRAHLHIFDDAEKMAAGAARAVADRLSERLRTADRAFIALAGGTTPRRLYELLAAPPAAGRVAWERVHFFWGDERCVPPRHPDSNYRMARRALLDPLAIPETHVHRMRGELADPETAASAYAAELEHVFGTTAPQLPRFDLALLGMGTDGHTASLFPGSAALDERRRLVAAVPGSPNRLTLTLPVINDAGAALFLVAGEAKAEMLARVLAPGANYPAQCVQPTDGELHFFMDRAAASRLDEDD